MSRLAPLLTASSDYGLDPKHRGNIIELVTSSISNTLDLGADTCHVRGEEDTQSDSFDSRTCLPVALEGDDDLGRSVSSHTCCTLCGFILDGGPGSYDGAATYGCLMCIFCQECGEEISLAWLNVVTPWIVGGEQVRYLW